MRYWKMPSSRIITSNFRLATAFFALCGTFATWTLAEPHNLIYFTHQSNIFLGVIFVWAGVATLVGLKQPPAWLKNAALLYILITGLVANLILDTPNHILPTLLTMNTNAMVHIITPIMALIDFLFFTPHRQLKIKHAALWLLYPAAYFIFVLIIVGIFPALEYPYSFIDLNVLTTSALIQNIIIYSIAFYLLGLSIVGTDRILPE
jgi:hypothetical protein